MPPLQPSCLAKSGATATWLCAAYRRTATTQICQAAHLAPKTTYTADTQSQMSRQKAMCGQQHSLHAGQSCVHGMPDQCIISMRDLGLLLQQCHDAMNLFSSLPTHLVWSCLSHMPEPAELLLHPARLAVGSAWSTVSAWLQVASWTADELSCRSRFQRGAAADSHVYGMSAENRGSRF